MLPGLDLRRLISRAWMNFREKYKWMLAKRDLFKGWADTGYSSLDGEVVEESSRASPKAAQLLNLAATECRPAGPSAGQKCKWINYLQRWSAKGLADLL
jgi:hypothetical protein